MRRPVPVISLSVKNKSVSSYPDDKIVIHVSDNESGINCPKGTRCGMGYKSSLTCTRKGSFTCYSKPSGGQIELWQIFR